MSALRRDVGWTHRTKLMCTPMFRWTLEHSRQMYTPNVTLDHVGFLALQSKQTYRRVRSVRDALVLCHITPPCLTLGEKEKMTGGGVVDRTSHWSGEEERERKEEMDKKTYFVGFLGFEDFEDGFCLLLGRFCHRRWSITAR